MATVAGGATTAAAAGLTTNFWGAGDGEAVCRGPRAVVLDDAAHHLVNAMELAALAARWRVVERLVFHATVGGNARARTLVGELCHEFCEV